MDELVVAVADGAQRFQQEVQNAEREIKVHTKGFVYKKIYDVPSVSSRLEPISCSGC